MYKCSRQVMYLINACVNAYDKLKIQHPMLEGGPLIG